MTLAVNGTAIPDSAVDAEVQYHPSATLVAARHRAAEALVVRALLVQEADRLGIAGAGEEERLGRLLEQEVRVPEPDAEACRRYYQANATRLRSPDLFEAAHILFEAAPADAEGRERARAAAVAAIRQLEQDPRAFAVLARAHSACPSATEGGHLGQVTRGDVMPEVATMLMALADGQLCPVPVPTRFGFHVLRLDRKLAGQSLPYEAVAGRIAELLAERAWRVAVRQYIAVLAGRAAIEGIQIRGADGPLVQ